MHQRQITVHPTTCFISCIIKCEISAQTTVNPVIWMLHLTVLTLEHLKKHWNLYLVFKPNNRSCTAQGSSCARTWSAPSRRPNTEVIRLNCLVLARRSAGGHIISVIKAVVRQPAARQQSRLSQTKFE